MPDNHDTLESWPDANALLRALARNSHQAKIDVDSWLQSGTATLATVIQAAIKHGYTPIHPLLVVPELSRCKDNPQKAFQVIAEFAEDTFHLRYEWKVSRETTWDDVLSVYPTTISLSMFPRELHMALSVEHKKVYDSMSTLTFRTNSVGVCGMAAGGCYGGEDAMYADTPRKIGYSWVSTRVSNVALHEWGHKVHTLLLGESEFSEILHECDPPGFDTVSYQAWEKDRNANPASKAVADTYGRVETEVVSTLFSHLPMFDVSTFEGFTADEMDPDNPSPRVQKLARAVAAIGRIIDNRHPERSFTGYIADIFAFWQVAEVRAALNASGIIDDCVEQLEGFSRCEFVEVSDSFFGKVSNRHFAIWITKCQLSVAFFCSSLVELL